MDILDHPRIALRPNPDTPDGAYALEDLPEGELFIPADRASSLGNSLFRKHGARARRFRPNTLDQSQRPESRESITCPPHLRVLHVEYHHPEDPSLSS